MRMFAPDAPPRQVIEDALLTAGSAPSGANLQPWQFVVVESAVLRHNIRIAAEAEEREFYNGRAPQEWLDALAPLGTDADKSFLDVAPVLIAIFAKGYELLPDGRKVKNHYANESTGIATGMLISALHNAGLATLTHTPSPMAFLNNIAKTAGLPGLNINQVFWNQGILPGETALREPNQMLSLAGFDSITSYVWIHHVPLREFPAVDYQTISDEYFAFWQRTERDIQLPYYPNATVGWDASPRTAQSDAFEHLGYPFTPVVVNNTPANFKKALERIKTQFDTWPADRERVLTINSWNEWTEGSYLEPDTLNGLGYLEAIRDVFDVS